jgi:stalled ribosome rescue protein Dom34
MKKMTPKSYKRGYPVAILAGIEQTQAVLWKIFSHVAKQEASISLNGNRADSKALYSFHEAIVNALRPTLKEGVRSIIIASPPKNGYSHEFFGHLKAHHAWLFSGNNKATITEIAGSAATSTQVSSLTSTSAFKQLISETTVQETENLMEILEKRLNTADQLVLFSLQEAENAIFSQQPPGKPTPEYLLLTDNYLAGSRQKNRVHRLMQIAQNRKVKTKIVSTESPAGVRLNQLGGLVCLLKVEQ